MNSISDTSLAALRAQYIQPSVRKVFTNFFNHVAQIDRLYHWPEPFFAMQINLFRPSMFASQAQWHLELRRCLTIRWRAAGSGAKGQTVRRRIAHHVVNEWGGIKGNADKTINHYVNLASKPVGDISLKGIASFSKILAVAAPDKHAIYDARVAAALNALQVLEIGMNAVGIAFPSLPTQNKAVTQFNRYFNSQLSRCPWHRLKSHKAYAVYLALLRDGVRDSSGDQLQKREMLLFAMADRLCNTVLRAQ